jgi:hypothetical protein
MSESMACHGMSARHAPIRVHAVSDSARLAVTVPEEQQLHKVNEGVDSLVFIKPFRLTFPSLIPIDNR